MKIKSKTKDYYDHIAHQYDGGDPKVVYVRGSINDDINDAFIIELDYMWSLVPEFIKIDEKKIKNLSWILVNGKRYISCIEDIGGIEKKSILTEDSHPKLFQKTRLWAKDLELLNESTILEIHRKYKQPVLEIVNPFRDTFEVRSKIPNLGELGFASIMKPEQLYQELSYFVGNMLNESPDLAPPVEVSNKDKIQQHGFDLKQSFRHRK